MNVSNRDRSNSKAGIPDRSGPDSLDWTPGSVLLDDYTIERILGHGGMGEVALIRSHSMQRYYAVKRILPKWLSKDRFRRMFLQELLTWSDLPEHPNLTAFRFFRTTGDELLIFTDYISGGSLKQWINDGEISDLRMILHIAIQIAWGLHVAHECGVLHQDVKPDNILMDSDGTVRITDFGLARIMRIRSDSIDESGTDEDEQTASPSSIKATASCSGGTPAFCSPEQYEKKPLTRGADIWSWGLTVLAMFCKGVPWTLGPMARDIFRNYLDKDPVDPTAPVMPNALANILDRCFQFDPDKRFDSFSEIIGGLIAVYGDVCREPYPESLAEIVISNALPVNEFKRTTVHELRWCNPAGFVEAGCRSLGFSPLLLTRIIPEKLHTRKAMAIADLILFEESRRILERATDDIRSDPEHGLARLFIEKAFLHRFLGDVSGALRMYECAIELMESSDMAIPDEMAFEIYREKGITLNLMQKYREADAYLCHVMWIEDQRSGLISDSIRFERARLMNIRARTLKALGNRDGAMELFDRSIAEYEAIIDGRPDHPVNQYLAGVMMNKANCFSKSGADEASIAMYDRATTILERIARQESGLSIREDLALVYSNKAAALYSRGNYSGAAELYQSAVAIREHLMNAEGCPEVAPDLASNYSNLANALWAKGDMDRVGPLYDRAIDIRDRLVLLEGRSEYSLGLVGYCNNRAYLASQQHDFNTAERLTRLARRILIHLINLEPREELDFMMGRITQSRADALNMMGDYGTALSTIDDAIRIWERLSGPSANLEHRGYFAISLACRARILANCRKIKEAIDTINGAIQIFHSLLKDGEWNYFIIDLFNTRRNLVSLLEQTGRIPDALTVLAGTEKLIENLLIVDDRSEYRLEQASILLLKYVLHRTDISETLPDEIRNARDLLKSADYHVFYPEISTLLRRLE